MAAERVPLYVRLPREQADELDRLVVSTGRRKQHLVSELLADRLVVGRAELTRADDGEVMTLEEAAALLRVNDAAIREQAETGLVPARRLGEEWRFSRSALLAWLSRTSED